MRVTVCNLPDEPAAWSEAWQRLAEHARAHASDLVLLPELTGHPWFATGPEPDDATWEAAVAAHDALVKRLPELGAPVVLGTRAMEEDDMRLNQAFVWTEADGYRRAHEKVFFPDEPGWHEARWFDRWEKAFVPVEVAGLEVGFMTCTDVMFNEHARRYGREGVHVVAVPRASEAAPRWEVAIRMAAVAAGAYAISSNWSGAGHLDDTIQWGATGLVVDPEGVVLARTTEAAPFATVDIDPAVAEKAKKGYPRYVEE